MENTEKDALSADERRKRVIACAAFFHENPAYRRMMEEMRRKYKTYGRPAGEIVLRDASGAECDAARGILCETFTPPIVKFKTAHFEEAIRNTPYSGVTLRELLEEYFGDRIRTAREAQAIRTNDFSCLLSDARGQGSVSDAWLDELALRRGAGYAALKRAAEQNPQSASVALLRACRGLRCLEQQRNTIRLAVLGAQAVSNPHAFDSGTLCGSLFLHLLCFRTGEDFPKNAVEEAALYDRNGIIRDSISSTVTQVGLSLYTKDGEHPAYAAFRQRRESCVLTLANLETLTAAFSSSGRAYVVENEMVFTQLCDHAKRFHSPLICTSGQPSVAALRLLDLLDNSGMTLLYSGDFDGRGLSITAQLAERYSGRLIPWHMEPEDYALCRSEEALTERSASLLRTLRALPATADAVLNAGYAGYQELLLPLLEKDLI